MSNLDSFVSGGTQGSVVFRRPNALLRTRILALSLALAAFPNDNQVSKVP